MTRGIGAAKIFGDSAAGDSAKRRLEPCEICGRQRRKDTWADFGNGRCPSCADCARELAPITGGEPRPKRPRHTRRHIRAHGAALDAVLPAHARRPSH